MCILPVFVTIILLSTQVSTIENRYDNFNTIVNPHDLEDQVRAQLEDLRFLVTGNIYMAFTNLESLVLDIRYYIHNALTEAEIRIQQEYETLNQQIDTLKNLAQSNGHNVDICLETNEPLLTQLPQIIIDNLTECLDFAERERAIILNEAKYRIDTFINEVNIFDFQLDKCASDFLCIEPLAVEIELAKINIPPKIGIEVQRTRDLYDTLKVSIRGCTDDKVGQFVSEATTIADDVSNCISGILS